MNANTRKLGYTTSEAARRLGVSLSTIRRWSDMGYLRGYRTPGGQRRFSVQQLDEFLESLESGGESNDEGHERGVFRHHEDPQASVLTETAGTAEHSRTPSSWPPANAA